MAKTNWDKAAIVVSVLMLLALILLVCFFFLVKAEGSAHCRVSGIQLVDVSQYGDCYGDFNEHYCPIPKEIDCEVSGKVPLLAMIRNW